MCASVLIGMFVIAGGGEEGDDGERNGKWYH
jgi:hypothetical protein